MRILFLTPNPPSPIRVRSFEFARALRDRGHSVDLVFPVGSPREVEDRSRLETDGFRTIARPLTRPRRAINLLRSIHSAQPLQATYAWAPRLLTAMCEAIGEAERTGYPYDLLHVEHLRGAAYGTRLSLRPPVVWDAVDSISLLFTQSREHAPRRLQRWLACIELGATRRVEGELVNRLRHVAVTSESDRAALMALHFRRQFARPMPVAAACEPDAVSDHQPDIRVVPNGVDLSRFAACDSVEREPDTLVFSGKLGYHANEAAVRHLVDAVMPQVWNERPATRLLLAGASPPRSLRKLAEADPRIELTGYVEDLRTVLCRARVAVAPLVYGVGIQNKVLEAMACATPVVASPVALQALGAKPGEEVIVGAGPSELAEQIVALLDAPEHAASVGAAGRAYVAKSHRWSDAAANLEALYESARSSHR